MYSLTTVDRVEDLSLLQEGLVEPLQAQAYQLTNPSCHLALHDAAGVLIARCSLWDRHDANGVPVPDGLVGHYAAANTDAGKELLEYASNLHREKGHERVIGPMDKSTWHRYRFLTDRGTEPTFFLEPDNPDEWPNHFTEAGFVPLATYTSALNPDLNQVDPRSDERWDEFKRNGITMRTLEMAHFEDELAAIHELSIMAFVRNYLYSPIPFEEFLTSYAPIRTHLLPELVLLMEHDERLVGFIFAIPDLLEPARDAPMRTVILKSMAVHPEYGGSGLGGILMDEVQRAAQKLGFERAIHALMQETNLSRRISSHYGTTTRRYTLYERPL